MISEFRVTARGQHLLFVGSGTTSSPKKFVRLIINPITRVIDAGSGDLFNDMTTFSNSFEMLGIRVIDSNHIKAVLYLSASGL